jgi:ubiquitin-conjugating enzyme E2 G2
MAMSFKRLLLEYKEIALRPPQGVCAGPIDEGNLFEWECLFLGPEGTPYDGGCFRASLSFPKDYPLNPPVMKFTSPLWHPNIYPDGTVCISILHPVSLSCGCSRGWC